MKSCLIKKYVLALLFISSTVAFAETATIISTTGKVEVNRNEAWVPVNKDTVIREGEIISTGFKSEALIKYKDSVMKLGPLTRITLEKLASSDTKDDVSVYLSTGSVRSTVNHSENRRISYTVRNPIAVASVRGTVFDFDGLANIGCDLGGVLVTAAENVDPVKDLGIKNPADKNGLISKNPTENTNEENVTKDPAEGTTNSFTSTEDINPNLAGGILITGGQRTDFTDTTTSSPSRAKTETEVNITSFTSDLNTASDTEFIPTVDTNVNGISSEATTQQKGKLVITLTFEE